MKLFFGFVFFLLAYGCEQKPCVVNVPPPASAPIEKFKLMEGTYWTTSKAGTVLQVKTVFRFNAETGETDYLQEGLWYVTK